MAKKCVILSRAEYKQMKRQIVDLTRKCDGLESKNYFLGIGEKNLLEQVEMARSQVLEMQNELYPLKEELFLLKRGEKATPL